MIFNAVHCATKVPLIDGEDDPTLLDFTEVMEILFAKAVTRLKPIMGNAKLAAFLRDLAQCLDEETFNRAAIRSVMSKYLDHCHTRAGRGPRVLAPRVMVQ